MSYTPEPARIFFLGDPVIGRAAAAYVDTLGLAWISASFGSPEANVVRPANTTIVICLNRAAYQASPNLPLRTLIWDIHQRNALHAVPARVQELVHFLRRTPPAEKIAVLDRDGTPTGMLTTIKEAGELGLWHLGAHVVLINERNELLLVRRSMDIVGSPGLWEIGVGGSAAAGETSAQAAVREVCEEIGITLDEATLSEPFRFAYSHYLPHYGLHSRAFVDSFAAHLAESSQITLQLSEADEAGWVPLTDVKHAVRTGRGPFGRFVGQRAYYARLVHLAEQAILRLTTH
jgi:8-oxo-dGTP pyrophosphatase MutT (NUDIX family)